jgi:uncharacterized protein (DUF697 family)
MLRDLYHTLRETRQASRREVTFCVRGDSPEARQLAELLNAPVGVKRPEVLVEVSTDGPPFSLKLSGPAVEEAEELELAALTEEAVHGKLVPTVVRAVEEERRLALARGYPPFRKAVCEDVIRRNAVQNAAIGALPVPGADMPVMTANQGRMVLSIAASYGEEISVQRVRELVGVLGVGVGLRALGRQAVKLVPVGGWAAAGAIGYAGTLAVGRAAVLYFERGGVKPSNEEFSVIRERALEETRRLFRRSGE